MLLQRTNLLLALSLVVGAGCSIGGSPDPGIDGPVATPPPGETPPPDKTPPPTAAVYKRGSLQPLYQLTPEQELNRFDELGIALKDTDFQINVAAGFTTASQKMDQLGRQIAAERASATLDIVSAEDRTRSDKIPFRGNPSDVKLLSVNGKREAWVPLGGDLMTPGFEVVPVDITNPAAPVRGQIITVGVRPQRVVAHPSQPTQLLFVCNQFSNYISVIDVVQKQLLVNSQNVKVEVPTEFYCTDLVFAPRDANANDPDKQDLYVSNSYRGSVLKYGITLVRGALNNRIEDIKVDPVVEITGVGTNPTRLSLGQDNKTLFVAGSRGGEIARIDLASRSTRKFQFNAPAMDIVQANDILLVSTTTVDRGLPDRNDTMPTPQFAPKVMVTGIDGAQHEAHPGSLTDNTKSYNFEDLRNGVLTIDAQLTNGNPQYITDNISPEKNFVAAQKVLQGSLPLAVIVDKATHTRAFFAMSGSDVVQELKVVNGAFRLADGPTPLFQTAKRPFQMALDEATNQLIVVSWGGEQLEIFNAAANGNAARLGGVDLGYGGNGNAAVAYPATNIERGEYLFYNTSWSNNGRKSCAQCHTDELLVDGIPYANGATAASAYHKVTANFNLMQTDNYFWNGSFRNGTYASLASDAQSRSNCELILFGQIEGISSDVATRVGDPINIASQGAAVDQECRPDLTSLVQGVLPANFARIADIIALSKLTRDANIRTITANLGLGALGFQDVSRFTDWYGVAELRLPPNPLAYLYESGQLASDVKAAVDRGQALFMGSGCGNCHNPNNNFIDGRNHGGGSTWPNRFIAAYSNDARLLALLPAGIPENMLQARRTLSDDKEINVHASTDYFVPFCFDAVRCLQFDDPLAAPPKSQLETDRLQALITINLANVERGFMPGNVVGQPSVNTPSLRGLFFQNNFLRHGLARSLNETILAPGHPALGTNERGFAIDRFGNKDVHGNTSSMTKENVDDLYLYLTSIK